jgi:phosphoribosylanthranilate isomerase
MALNTIVKVGSISNLSDARYCAGMGAQYLGFNLDSDQPEYVDPPTFKSIKDWVVGPKIVGEISSFDLNTLEQILEQYEIDSLEITQPEALDRLYSRGLPIILKLDIAVYQDVDRLHEIMTKTKPKVSYFILERSAESVIQEKDVVSLASHFKIMTGFSVDKDNLSSWLDGTDIYGISIKGGIESRAGFKDYDAIAEILEALEID